MIIKMHDKDLVVAEDISVVTPGFEDDTPIIEVNMRNGGDICFTYEFETEAERDEALKQIESILGEIHKVRTIDLPRDSLPKASHNLSSESNTKTLGPGSWGDWAENHVRGATDW